jgi:hypothetical protein
MGVIMERRIPCALIWWQGGPSPGSTRYGPAYVEETNLLSCIATSQQFILGNYIQKQCKIAFR